jgi:pimeloyl-ACP methyl ester carboxylesterase
MKIRKDRVFVLQTANYPKLLILGKKDGVLNYEDNLKQIENTDVQLVSFPDGHMSHTENREELKTVLLDFF